MEKPNRYWLSFTGGNSWHEVSEDEWCNVEALCGFHGGLPVTAGFTSQMIRGAGFTSQMIRGHMHYGSSNSYGCDIGPCVDIRGCYVCKAHGLFWGTEGGQGSYLAPYCYGCMKLETECTC